MKNYLCGFALWALLSAAGAACGKENHTDISIGKELSVASVILNEQRAIKIALPDSYRANHKHTRYPVLYLLDGEKFFHAVAGTVQHLSADASPRTPELIIVGITSQQRVRDSSPSHSLRGPLGKNEAIYQASGGADNFLRFLTDELIPHIDKTYSTSGYRVLAGYSFTGVPVLHALFTQPQSFNAYLSIDPSWWWDDYLLERQAREFIAGASVEGRALFVTTTTNNPPLEFLPRLRYVDTLSGMLQAKPVRGLRFGIKIYDDETHHSLTLRSVYDGLSHIFHGYTPTLDSLYAHPEGLGKQYQSLSGRLGTEVFLREELVNYFGYFFLYTHPDIDKALLYFKLNTRHYPSSANAWDSLAEAYVVKGDRKLAVESYKKSLAINPANSNAVAQLEKLGIAVSGSQE